jgi:hypothetical protein
LGVFQLATLRFEFFKFQFGFHFELLRNP